MRPESCVIDTRHSSVTQSRLTGVNVTMPHQLLATCDRTARSRRDRALLLFGFTGALRLSEQM
jgi:hypothetical protein